jgi:hypothetical protein
MNDRPEEMHSQDEQDTAPSLPDSDNEPETSNRRELIERCAKIAIIASPLLLFVSKAQAIHSKP